VIVEEAYAECERITREQARNFYWGIRLLPPAKRNALCAVYAFARRVDDIGDGTLPDAEKLSRLADARRDAADPRARPDDPVLVPLDAFGELVSGCEQDVRGHKYADLDDLVQYCRYVAGSIGRLSLGVFSPALAGPRAAQASGLADALGVALQLTNVLRDIREDLLNGRVYLPTADLDLFGVELSVRDDGRLDPCGGALAELIRFEAARAWGWYDRGLQLLPLLDRRSAACCAAMAGIYHELLQRIAADPSLVMSGRLSLPAGQKLRVAGSALGRSLLGGGSDG
jgi:phytoene synthase